MIQIQHMAVIAKKPEPVAPEGVAWEDTAEIIWEDTAEIIWEDT